MVDPLVSMAQAFDVHLPGGAWAPTFRRHFLLDEEDQFQGLRSTFFLIVLRIWKIFGAGDGEREEVWKPAIPLKVKVLMWRIAQGRLDQGLTEGYSCPTCRRPLFLSRSGDHTGSRVRGVANEERVTQVNLGLNDQRISAPTAPSTQQQNPSDGVWRETGAESTWAPPRPSPAADDAGTSALEHLAESLTFRAFCSTISQKWQNCCWLEI
ncbi:hypothetical protein Taro_013749 [Colocasia esculenta]|uniref:Uncharacterized protein n=1 Tax=Colocasia esculenta TaxID=4460 RepID=A0A843UHD5_COLES|nr:hypothetical protein [Colocasia esculenta]